MFSGKMFAGKKVGVLIGNFATSEGQWFQAWCHGRRDRRQKLDLVEDKRGERHEGSNGLYEN